MSIRGVRGLKSGVPRPESKPLSAVGMQTEMTSEQVAQEQKKREPLIRAALRLIAPQPEFSDTCRSDIEDSLNTIDVTTAYLKKDVRALKSLQSALVRPSRADSGQVYS
jgi:hypothetical protein